MSTDKPTYPSDAAEKFIVRLPPGMRERIAESAKENGRSMNAEVVARLQNSFSRPDEVKFVLDLEAERLNARAAAVGVRAELLDAKKQMLEMSINLKSLEIEKQLSAAKTDADLSAVKKRVNEYRMIEEEAKALALQGDALIQERDKHSAEIDHFLATVEARRRQLESSMADYVAKRKDKGA